MAGATWKCSCLGASPVYTIQPCSMSLHAHIRKVYACLAVTCYLHFWQNDRDLFRATVATRGWNRYWNKSQHRKLTLKKKILLPLQQGFEPVTFQSQVWHSNHWAIPVIAVSNHCEICQTFIHWCFMYTHWDFWNKITRLELLSTAPH